MVRKTVRHSEWEDIPGFDPTRREYIRLDGDARPIGEFLTLRNRQVMMPKSRLSLTTHTGCLINEYQFCQFAKPCTAMVFVWSNFLDGEPHFTLTQVALNDTIMVFPFAPIVGVLVEVSVMLSVVRIVNKTKNWYEGKAAS